MPNSFGLKCQSLANKKSSKRFKAYRLSFIGLAHGRIFQSKCYKFKTCILISWSWRFMTGGQIMTGEYVLRDSSWFIMMTDESRSSTRLASRSRTRQTSTGVPDTLPHQRGYSEGWHTVDTWILETVDALQNSEIIALMGQYGCFRLIAPYLFFDVPGSQKYKKTSASIESFQQGPKLPWKSVSSANRSLRNVSLKSRSFRGVPHPQPGIEHGSKKIHPESTLKLTAKAPESWPKPQETHLNQPQCFRCKNASFRQSTLPIVVNW